MIAEDGGMAGELVLLPWGDGVEIGLKLRVDD